MKPIPALVISLDFELYWGMRDCVSLDDYRANLLGVREVVPALLQLFSRRGIHATWATVGFLFCRTRAELEATVPDRIPKYSDPTLSPYDFTDVGENEQRDPLHFAPSLIEAIAGTPGQEVATHTFSHYYCLESGQSADDFTADLRAARVAAGRLGIELKSLVFPRNQENPAYRSALARSGLRAFRPAAYGWAYQPATSAESRFKRAVRFADAYAPLTGRRSFAAPRRGEHGLTAVPGSLFLRPYAESLRPLDRMLVRRVVASMRSAAERGELFHLWWHPHNFGVNLRENIARLTAILDEFAALSKEFGMESLSMSDVADRAAALEIG